jgi:alpha-2-macroglobulin
LNGQEKTSFAYGPQTILNQDKFSFNLKDLGFNKLSAISFQKTNNNKEANNFYYDLSLKYYLPANAIAPRDEGFSITKNFYKPDDKDFENPIKEATVGDVLVGKIKVMIPKDRNFVAIEDYIPAGMELVNFNLNTENRQAMDGYYNDKGNGACDYLCEYWSWQDMRKIYPDFQENRDDRLFLYKERLSQGEYEYTYYVRVLVPGKFIALPSVASEMYFPENFGRTGGSYFVVNENKN